LRQQSLSRRCTQAERLNAFLLTRRVIDNTAGDPAWRVRIVRSSDSAHRLVRAIGLPPPAADEPPRWHCRPVRIEDPGSYRAWPHLTLRHKPSGGGFVPSVEAKCIGRQAVRN
jgi:hypothetical protein